MKTMLLRFYDDELHRRLKFNALKKGITLQDIVIESCEKYIEKNKIKDNEHLELTKTN